MAESLGQECSRRQAFGLWKVWQRGIEKPVGERIGEKRSGLKEAGWDAIVAVELHVIEGGGDSVPTGHGRGFAALHVSPGGEKNATVTHGLADENDIDLERSSDGEGPWAEEIDTSRADVARNQGDWKFLGDIVDAAQSQRELQAGARIFAVLWEDADGMSRHAGEPTGLSVRT